MILKTGTYSHNGNSTTHLAKNTTRETSSINKNDIQWSNNSHSKLEVSLNNDLEPSISLTSEMEIPTSSILEYSSTVPELEATDTDLENSTADITGETSQAALEIISSISIIVGGNDNVVHILDSYTFSNMAAIVSSVKASVSSDCSV